MDLEEVTRGIPKGIRASKLIKQVRGYDDRMASRIEYGSWFEKSNYLRLRLRFRITRRPARAIQVLPPKKKLHIS
jgi:hypothetical protein